MKLKKLRLFSLPVMMCLAGALHAPAEAQLRIVTYNTLDKPVSLSDDSQFQTIFGAIATEPVNGIVRPVDVLALQEQTLSGSVNTATDIANLLNALHNTTSYSAITTGNGVDRLAIVYNSSTVDLLGSTSIGVGIRPGVRGHFRPVGYTDAGSDFYVYSAHLKAGSSSSDFTTRASEVNNLRNNADALGADANVIFAGDFNLQSSFDDAYQNFFASGNAQAVDPSGLSFWGSSTPELMTQSTRTTTLSDGGVPGGLDDRFDFQLVSEEVANGSGFAIITPESTGSAATSYRAFGNDGTSYNQAINATTTGRSQPASVLNALHDFSDHLPVVADYQLPALLDLDVSITATDVFAGTGVAVLANVDNVAPVATDNAADSLSYSMTATGDVSSNTVFTGDLSVSDTPNSHAWLVDTSAAGQKDSTVSYTSASDGVADRDIDVTVNVFDHATASFASDSVTKSLEIDFGTVELGFSEGQTEDLVTLFNLESTVDFTSALAIDSDWMAVSGDTSTLGFLGTFPVEGDLDAGESRFQVVTLDTTTAGTFSATYELEVGDALEAAGALTETLTLTLLAEVVSSLLAGDYNGNGVVDAADYTVWQDSFGSTVDLAADGNGNGVVDAADYTVWQDNFGSTSGGGSSVVIPEPGTVTLVGLGLLGLSRRGRRAG
ncbi:endonuclease/exonuclease/phosphatase family protein [Algisphaera agarilytica]|uniref:Endonuclease/exonuclease/phosphatase family metal-dependent hydrolase n=1 Tax=Algisphaera agarilytica TaxID=1385975 RepID=A0A7X0H5U7_9BACT|nr:endonuclease/exonuclease/phosphatase family protein [Algisphaera agarilytica]MBB6429688.1 endonuclease/exonuclease/phosphatase family metal-dependent hydrolase [Algisphaera agarilytica]